MNAIILAAGMAKRYDPPLAHPKCLLEIGGKSLLRRSIENLTWAGCDAVTVVAGYRVEMILAELESFTPDIPVQVLINSAFDKGSTGSVLYAAAVFEREATLMLDSDLLYDGEIPRRLIRSPHENAIAVDSFAAKTTCESWAAVEDSLVKKIYIDKRRGPDDTLYLGVHKFSAETGKNFVRQTRLMFRNNPDFEYWYVIIRLLKENRLGVVEVGDLAYVEMDTHAEYEFARDHVYPQLSKPVAGGRADA